MIQVEEKLYQNRYRVDEGRPHIKIKDREICSLCSHKICTVLCPAGCYRKGTDSAVSLITDGCLECGTCQVICLEHKNILWEYPRGGYGILYKFG
ncbi:ferredoxin family protein [Methylacidiphilum caldifontis]|uniref:Ferredoxin-like protein n=1 Tax=Methylacidiphilum caldifontis TaxID=2795386 RepID=A0A4Y8PAN7_9BACT|nr:ferredoxin family protein [Methylacidiphilum caldifontis]TFE67934.1 ferredoxin [Methylacidiphilum caldifontis]